MSSDHEHGTKECMKIFERLSEYLDGDLEEELRSRIDGHMGDCPPCTVFLESLRRTVDWVQDVGPPPLTAEQRDVLRRACRDFLDDDDDEPEAEPE